MTKYKKYDIIYIMVLAQKYDNMNKIEYKNFLLVLNKKQFRHLPKLTDDEMENIQKNGIGASIELYENCDCIDSIKVQMQGIKKHYKRPPFWFLDKAIREICEKQKINRDNYYTVTVAIYDREKKLIQKVLITENELFVVQNVKKSK